MKELDILELHVLPLEIINLIADFHDYHKYYKPIHKKKFKLVLIDILVMGYIFESDIHTISPYYARVCWGPFYHYIGM